MSNLNFDSELITTLDGHRIGHSKHIQLLENIQRFGSISQAAKAIPMSYKAAWDAINELNHLAPEPLVIRYTGGQGGGQSILTPFGKKFVQNYRHIQNQHQQIMQQLQCATPDTILAPTNQYQTLDNQLTATISHMIRGSINHEIKLKLSNGLSLIAQIPATLSTQMALIEGLTVCALIPMNAILLVCPTPHLAISARNQLSAHIKQLNIDTVNSVVQCDLGKNVILNVLITRTSARSMDLKVGNPIVLLIKAPSILVSRL